MAKDTQIFEATPTLAGNKVKWKLCHTNPDPDECGESNGTYPDVILGANKGGYDFQFKIVNDQTGLGIKFAATNPISIKKGEPSGPGTEKQIDQVGLNGTNVLNFKDKNSMPNRDHPNPVVLDYQLNFTNQNNQAVTSIDPDITNGGTNTMYADLYDYLIPIGALLAGIVLTVMFRSFVLRRAW
jgi:hypothetical protein